jgi:predicted amidophosphoribosyltransferase
MSITQLFSQRCACCGQPGPVLCRPCRFSLGSSTVVSDSSGITAALSFEGAARRAILSLKYRNKRPVARHLATLMVRRLHLGGYDRRPFDVVTWAPTSSAHLRSRGFDQAELLAREVARQLGVPCRRLLYRSHGSPQTGRSRVERLAADGPAFRARFARPDVRVLVVDDVFTTGSTLRAAGRALGDAGVRHVRLVAAAATPHGAHHSPESPLRPPAVGRSVDLQRTG